MRSDVEEAAGLKKRSRGPNTGGLIEGLVCWGRGGRGAGVARGAGWDKRADVQGISVAIKEGREPVFGRWSVVVRVPRVVRCFVVASTSVLSWLRMRQRSSKQWRTEGRVLSAGCKGRSGPAQNPGLVQRFLGLRVLVDACVLSAVDGGDGGKNEWVVMKSPVRVVGWLQLGRAAATAGGRQMG